MRGHAREDMRGQRHAHPHLADDDMHGLIASPSQARPGDTVSFDSTAMELFLPHERKLHASSGVAATYIGFFDIYIRRRARMERGTACAARMPPQGSSVAAGRVHALVA